MSKRLQTVAESQYGLPQPLSVQNPTPIIAKRDPNSQDTGFPLGQTWVNKIGNSIWSLSSVAGGGANWVGLGGGAAGVDTINGQMPVAGNFNMVGTANQITVTPAAGSDTFSFPADISVASSITTGTVNVPGTPNTIMVENLDNTVVGSNAVFKSVVNGPGGGDPYSIYSINGGQDWSVGLDKSTLDFTISESQTLGTNDALRIASGTRDVLVMSGNLAVLSGILGTVNGSFVLGTPGNKINIAPGVNASIGTDPLGAGTVTVATTAIAAGSFIFVSRNTSGGVVGHLEAPAASIIPGVSFVINSSSAADTSTINWWIIN